MNDLLTPEYINFIKNGELGENMLKTIEIIEQRGGNNTFVDIGVETGKSSKVLLHGALANNNKIFGVDPIPCISIPGILDHPNYTMLKKDSVTTGRDWLHGKVDIAFIDSIHAKEQVLMELFYWWDLIEVGGWAIFHDTNWSGYIHKPNHPCAGKKPGNSGLGYDFYQGIAWETPDKAILSFFKIEDLNHKDQNIECFHYPDSLGMTYICKKTNFDYKSLTTNWSEIENKRQILLKSFI